MKIGQLLASVQTLQKLVEQPLHLRQAYQLSKIANKVNTELGFFEMKRDQILNSEGTDEEKTDKFNELLNFEVDWTIDPVVFKFDDDIKLSASELDSCQGMIEIEE